MMNLGKATKLAAAGAVYTFVYRGVATLVPGWFTNIQVVQFSLVLSFVAGLFLVNFFYSFAKEYVSAGQCRLKNASTTAVIAAAALALLNVKELIVVFDADAFRSLARNRHVDAVVPWVCSLLFLYFFVVFYGEASRQKLAALKKATFVATLGSVVSAAMFTFTLVNYMYQGTFTTVADAYNAAPAVFLLIPAAAFAAVLYFFVVFYREHAGVDEQA